MPGTASRLPLSAGIQKLWMTSLDEMDQVDLAAGGHDQLGGGREVTLAVVAAVAVDVVLVAPPPLLAVDPHLQGIVARGPRARGW
jgi:hypothetical protein